MTFSKENISKRLSRLPMLKVLAATLAGICVGGVVPLRLWLAVAVVVGVLVAAVLFGLLGDLIFPAELFVK